jgi:hypothetical protein
MANWCFTPIHMREGRTILGAKSKLLYSSISETVRNMTHVQIYFFALNDRYYDLPEYWPFFLGHPVLVDISTWRSGRLNVDLGTAVTYMSLGLSTAVLETVIMRKIPKCRNAVWVSFKLKDSHSFTNIWRLTTILRFYSCEGPHCNFYGLWQRSRWIKVFRRFHLQS